MLNLRTQCVSSAPVAGCSTSFDVEPLSGAEIKAKISELGVKTKLRNEKKLRELLTLHLHELMVDPLPLVNLKNRCFTILRIFH